MREDNWMYVRIVVVLLYCIFHTVSVLYDEEWYSPKRPSSTVAVNSSELNTNVSAFFFSIFLVVLGL